MSLMYLIIILFWCCIWGAICQAVATNRNVNNGFLWGFCLGLIGLIVVLCMGSSTSNSNADNLEALNKLQQLKENGAISEMEYEQSKKKLLNKL